MSGSNTKSDASFVLQQERLHAYRSRGEYEKAIAAIDIYLRSLPPGSPRRLELLCVKSECQLRIAHFAEALATGFEALHEARDTGNHEWIGTALFRISAVYAGLQLLDSSIQYCEEAIEIHRKWKHKRAYITTLVGLVAIRILCGEIEEARKDAARAIRLASREGATDDVIKAKLYLAECLVAQTEYRKALSHALDANTIALASKNNFLIAKAAFITGRCYIRVKDYQNAENMLRRAEERFIALHDHGSRQSTLESLAEIQEAKGNMAEALKLCKAVLQIERDLLIEQRQSIRIQAGEDRRPIALRLARRCPSLTPAEVRVCELAVKLIPNKEIAKLLGTSSLTIERHRFNIRKKLGLPRGANLAVALLEI